MFMVRKKWMFGFLGMVSIGAVVFAIQQINTPAKIQDNPCLLNDSRHNDCVADVVLEESHNFSVIDETEERALSESDQQISEEELERTIEIVQKQLMQDIALGDSSLKDQYNIVEVENAHKLKKVFVQAPAGNINAIDHNKDVQKN